MKHRYHIWLTAFVAVITLATLAKPADAAMDPNCRFVPRPLFFNQSAADQKDPVVIVGGTMAAEFWYWILEGRLLADNYNLYFFELLEAGTIDLRINAASLEACVNEVLRRHPGRKVDLIGHSQGVLVARAYLRLNGGASVVDSMISLAGPHRGTHPENLLLQLMGATMCKDPNGEMREACKQMFLCAETAAARGGEPCFIDTIGNPDNPATLPSPDPVFYTNLVTWQDDIICPIHSGVMTTPIAELACNAGLFERSNFKTAFLNSNPCPASDAPGMSNACDVVLEVDCPLRLLFPLTHLNMANDGAIYSGIRNALNHQRGQRLECLRL